MTRDEALSALGLDRGASQEEIKAAYRQAAFWCHPDKNPGNRVAENTFKRIAEAYELLKENGSVRRDGGASGRNGGADSRAAQERAAAERAARERVAAERAAAKKAAEERGAAERRREAEKAQIRAEAARRAHCVRCGKFRELVVAVSKRRVCNDCLEAENVPDSVVRADLARLPAKLKELEAFAYDPKNFPKQEPSETKIVEGDEGTSAFYQDEEYWFWEEAPGSWAQAEIVGGERRIIKRGCPTKEEAMKYFRNHKVKDALEKAIAWRWVEGFTPGLGKVYVTHDWRALVAQGERKGWGLRRPWSLFIILHGKLGLAKSGFPTAEAAMHFEG